MSFRDSFFSLVVICLAIAGGFTLHALAQQTGVKRTELQRQDLSVAGREVIQVRVDLDPGVTFPAHSHPGEEIAYVLEGVWEYEIEGQPPVTLKAGESLFIPAGTVHSAKNVGSGVGSELATYIVEKGKPLVALSTHRAAASSRVTAALLIAVVSAHANAQDFQGEMFIIPRNEASSVPPAPSTVSFARKLEGLRLNVDKIGSVHGRSSTMDELRARLQETTTGRRPAE